ncbi:MAG: amidophosphoribosyltransferase [Halobacteriovoraceae bacterium]|nr:amidophosphoribosyltransferase [Halobacteriovoraceae bacterium]|tara:strand:+ start:9403 stop:10884 length:1482 start_codon:yes stop_codon:yes gene_type:complete
MCGIIGIIGTPNAAKESYLGLMMLQHRGQDSAGILAYDKNTHTFSLEKNLGHISSAISEQKIQEIPAASALGHTRYSTIGKALLKDIQPLHINYPFGIGMVHNGNIVNTEEVSKKLIAENQRFLFTNNDLELMMNILAEGLIAGKTDFNFDKIKTAVQSLYQEIQGGYSSLTLLAGKGMLAFKDPNGIRPMVWGKRELTLEEKEKNQSSLQFAYAFASESNALQLLGYENIQELAAGEIIFIEENGKVHQAQLGENRPRPCMFEWIYFANADSKIWNKSVYQLRLKFGQALASSIQATEAQFDIVVPVPDTSRPSAIALSENLNIPYREVLIKNRYAQRTFILNSQKDRDKMIKLKLSVVKEEVAGKNILLVDDSIVRGTTSKRIIKLLKQNGAASVSIASTCPPIISPCFYGIDFPTPQELVASGKSLKELALAIDADHVFYMDIEKFKSLFEELNTCMACVDKDYPTQTNHLDTMINKRVQHEPSHLSGIY